VPECGDGSLFPPGTSWEDEAQEREVEPREKRRTFLAPRGLFASQAGRARSSTSGVRAEGTRMPRFKRCNQRHHRANAAPSDSDLTSDAGGTGSEFEAESVEASDTASAGGRGRSSVKCQLGWLMRSESEAAFNETRPAGNDSSPALGNESSPATTTVSAAADEPPAEQLPSAVLAAAATVTSSASDQGNNEGTFSPSSEQEGSLVSFDSGAGVLESGRSHAPIANAGHQEPAALDYHLDVVPEDGPVGEMRLLRRSSAVLENPQAMELRDASVRDIKLFIARRERMLRV